MLDAGAMLIQERLSTEQMVMREEKENFQSKSNGAVQACHLNQGEPSIFEKKGRKGTKQGSINHRCLIRNGNGKKVRKS